MKQMTTVLMVRPAGFDYNEQTAVSNTFQLKDVSTININDQAVKEFDGFVSLLQTNGVNVIVVDDLPEPHTPDAIFPNNWISFHENGDIFLYPMQAENRRLERREDIVRKIKERFLVRHVLDLSRFELQHKFLEGTGSMVFDRANKIAYACLSPRTDLEVFNKFCEEAGYSALTFKAVDANGMTIYHTNVMMCIASAYAIICLDSINNQTERQAVIASLEQTGKAVINITFEQMNNFAGNMLEVFNTQGESLLIMSGSAFRSLDAHQMATLQKHSRIIYGNIPTIERNGGGSVRCMMAEVALPPLAD